MGPPSKARNGSGGRQHTLVPVYRMDVFELGGYLEFLKLPP